MTYEQARRYATSRDPADQSRALQLCPHDDMTEGLLARNPHICVHAARELFAARPLSQLLLMSNPSPAVEQSAALYATSTLPEVLAHLAIRDFGRHISDMILANPARTPIVEAGVAASSNPFTLSTLPTPWHPYTALRLAHNPATPTTALTDLCGHPLHAVSTAAERTCQQTIRPRRRWGHKRQVTKARTLLNTMTTTGYNPSLITAFYQATVNLPGERINLLRSVSPAQWNWIISHHHQSSAASDGADTIHDWLATAPDTRLRAWVAGQETTSSDLCTVMEHDPDPHVAALAARRRIQRLRHHAHSLPPQERAHALLLITNGFPGDIPDLTTVCTATDPQQATGHTR